MALCQRLKIHHRSLQQIIAAYLDDYSRPRVGGDGGLGPGAGRGDAAGVESPRHCRHCAGVELARSALVFFECGPRPGVGGAGPGGEQVAVPGVGLGLGGPPDGGLLPQGGQEGEAGEGEGVPVAPVVAGEDDGEAALLLDFQQSALVSRQ